MNPEDIESLNKYHKGLAIPLDHVPDPKDKSVLFYYTDDQKLLLVGMVESNYVFWFSETDLEDVERNRAIFAHIVRAKPTAFTDWFRMIPQTGYSYGRLASFYHERVRSGEQERKALKDTQWVTPFGHRYHVRSGPEEVGRFFADNIREHYRNLKLRCKSREAGGAYLGILQSYLEELSRSSGNPVTDYEEKKPLIDLIDSEQYLLCSDDPALRSLYLKLVYRGIELYNAYMYIVRRVFPHQLHKSRGLRILSAGRALFSPEMRKRRRVSRFFIENSASIGYTENAYIPNVRIGEEYG